MMHPARTKKTNPRTGRFPPPCGRQRMRYGDMIMANTISATPAKSSPGSPFGASNVAFHVPITSASPTPTGNATESPAASIPTTSRMFDKLKNGPADQRR